MGSPEDLLIPIDEQREIHDMLLSGGKASLWGELPSLFGHDSFLKEFDWMALRIKEFLGKN